MGGAGQRVNVSDIPYVGISIRSLNTEEGMEIVMVNSESPGWHAGLKMGDIILQVDGKTVNNIGHYKECLITAA